LTSCNWVFARVNPPGHPKFFFLFFLKPDPVLTPNQSSPRSTCQAIELQNYNKTQLNRVTEKKKNLTWVMRSDHWHQLNKGWTSWAMNQQGDLDWRMEEMTKNLNYQRRIKSILRDTQMDESTLLNSCLLKKT
jgi:hypothetical protein